EEEGFPPTTHLPQGRHNVVQDQQLKKKKKKKSRYVCKTKKEEKGMPPTKHLHQRRHNVVQEVKRIKKKEKKKKEESRKDKKTIKIQTIKNKKRRGMVPPNHTLDSRS